MSSVLAGTIGSVAANLASSGTSQVIGKLRRLNMLERVYREYNEIPQPVRVAANELQTVIGRNGALTDNFHAFLTDLLNNGLMTQMALAGLTGVTPSGTQQAFNTLYQTHFQHRLSDTNRSLSDAARVFGTLTRMLTRSIQNQASLEAAEFRSDVRFRELRDAVLRTENALKSQFQIRDNKGNLLNHAQLAEVRPWLAQHPDHIREVSQAIAKALLPHFERLTVEGPSERSIEVPLDDLYVASDLVPVELTTSPAGSPFRARSGERLTFARFSSEFDRAVVVGDPGGGKSTLGQKLCLDVLRSAERGVGPLPIQVTLRKFEAAKARDPQLSLLAFIVRSLAEQVGQYTSEELLNPIRNLLSYGRVFLFFDGLDEILAVGKRRSFVGDVMAFCAQFPLCRTLITSRKVGYAQAPMFGYPEYELLSFTDDQVGSYVKRASAHVFHRDAESTVAAADDFLHQARKQSDDLIRIPLLLSLMTWLYHSRHHIPDNRAEVYRECSQLMFQRWDKFRDIDPEIPDKHRLFALLTVLAHTFYLDPGLQDGASRQWLLRAVREFFVTDYSDNAEARAQYASEKFVEHLTGRAWVMREVGPGVYEFTHRTFLEYFFALWLDEEHETADALVTEIAPKIRAGEWNIPCHLALQMKVTEKRRRAQAVARRLIGLAREAKPSEVPTVVEFVAQATEYLQPPESELEAISEIVTENASDAMLWRDSFQRMLRTSNEMRPAMFRGLARGTSRLFEQRRHRQMGFMIDWLYAARLSRRGDLNVQTPPRMRPLLQLEELIADNVGPLLRELSDGRPAMTKARFDLLGELDARTAAEIGCRLWEEGVGAYGRSDWRLVDFWLMVSELSMWCKEKADLKELPYAFMATTIAPVLVRQAPYLISTKNPMVIPPMAKGKVDFDALSCVTDMDDVLVVSVVVGGLIDLMAITYEMADLSSVAQTRPYFSIHRSTTAKLGEVFRSMALKVSQREVDDRCPAVGLLRRNTDGEGHIFAAFRKTRTAITLGKLVC